MRTTLAVAIAALMANANGAEVEVVSSPKLAEPGKYGIRVLCDTLSSRGLQVEQLERLGQTDGSYVILAGLAGDRGVAARIAESKLSMPKRPEALAIRKIRDGKRHVVVLCGADPVGLMYAALDTAQRIGWAKDGEHPLAHVHNTSESPCMVERSISTYTMQRRWFEQRLHDASYWEKYFDLLAASRINSFALIFGYECGGFMAPLYPYFFDVEGFPDVELTDMTAQQQARNTAALQQLIELAHERGIRVTFGIWDHIYRGGVQGGGIPGASQLVGKRVPHLVNGVTSDNLAPYTKAALKTLLTVFPDVDGIQFRMHWESGLTREETPRFWRDIFATLRELNPEIRFDLRAKGLPDEVIQDAIDQRVPFRVTTKHWMEHLGMPFHPTHVNPQNQRDRRHGYADLLRYPKQYDVHWRVWSGGTARFLLWSDPDYVRRFVESSQIYGGDSFEFNEMLATKMLGEPHDAEPFQLHTPAYRHYDYEFERYWHYYQVWGRVSYDPEVDPEIWQREFARRFGDRSGLPVMKALHRASQILPRIVAAAYNYRYFPTTRGWAEVMRMGDLPQYAEGTGTDVEQFQSYREAARQLLSGEKTAKQTPQQTAMWFNRIAQQVLDDVAAVDVDNVQDTNQKRELQTVTTDLRILAHLARYHASRMQASVWYNIYLQVQDQFALDQCLAAESAAIAAWKQIIDSAGDVYPQELKFGVHRVGFSRHWTEELAKLLDGYAKLQELSGESQLDANTRKGLVQLIESPPAPSPLITIKRAKSATPGNEMLITAEVDGPPQQLEEIRLRYRHVTQFEDYRSVPMTWDAHQRKFVAAIPGDFVVPEWDLMYFVEVVFREGGGRMVPDLETEMPYVIVPVRR